MPLRLTAVVLEMESCRRILQLEHWKPLILLWLQLGEMVVVPLLLPEALAEVGDLRRSKRSDVL